MDSDLPLPAAASQTRGARGISFRNPTFWARFARWRHRILFASSPSDSIANVASSVGSNDSEKQNAQTRKIQLAEEGDAGDWEIDRVVVDSDFDRISVSHRHGRNSPSDREASDPPRTTGVDPSELAESITRSQPINGIKSFSKAIYMVLDNFFSASFVEPEAEEQFQKERWYNTKFLAWIATIFMIVNWVLYLIFNHSVGRYEFIAYYGISTFLTVPLPILVGLDFPRKHTLFFQIWLMFSSWFWAVSEVVQMRVCGFYTPNPDCGRKDFLFMMTYAVALPTVVLFSFNQKRLFATLGAVVQFVLICALILPQQAVFVRNAVSYFEFSAFFIMLHFYQERIDRRMFILRAQLKASFKAQQHAQIAEKVAASSKRRFVSYIFHEVRVPLNSALLAFQNLQANSVFKYCEVEQGVEIHALEGSLTMMQKVLNDVLDLQRMDSGRFESSALPFPFHRTVQSMLGTLKVATAAKNLGLNIELDERIDKCGIAGDLQGVWVIGDSMRLRQVLSNLMSNAVKFTPEGSGSVSVRTILISPEPSKQNGEHTTGRYKNDEPPYLYPPGPNVVKDGGHSDSVIIRIEVSDNGPGIRPSDLQDAQLFTPFVQTRLGVSQAGKGSGLGLAIVRQIVTLSGGRLGVQSRKNRGATFWVEFGFRLASSQEIENNRAVDFASIQDDISRPDFDRLGGLLTTTRTAQFNDRMPLETVAAKNSNPDIDRRSAPVSPPMVKSHSAPNALEKTSLQEETLVTLEPDRPLRVLVVDDDPLTRTLMTRLLSRLGCEVQTANDGQQFLDLLLGNGTPEKTLMNTPQYFDMVTLDNAMPLVWLFEQVMTGELAVRKLRASGRKDFVVGLTGNALKSDQVAYRKAGADEVLIKPVMMNNLKSMLQIALQRRAATEPP